MACDHSHCALSCQNKTDLALTWRRHTLNHTINDAAYSRQEPGPAATKDCKRTISTQQTLNTSRGLSVILLLNRCQSATYILCSTAVHFHAVPSDPNAHAAHTTSKFTQNIAIACQYFLTTKKRLREHKSQHSTTSLAQPSFQSSKHTGIPHHHWCTNTLRKSHHTLQPKTASERSQHNKHSIRHADCL